MTVTNVVVGVDGSDLARAAVGWARHLAVGRVEPRLDLVHAIAPIPDDAGYTLRLWDDLQWGGKAVLDQAAAQVGGVDVATHLVEGFPAAEILALGRQVGAELCVVGARGLGRAVDFLLGSVSSEVIYRSEAPVLVVKNDGAASVRRVLVGVDGSAHSVRALQFAAQWLPGAELVAMNVVHVPAETMRIFEQMEIAAAIGAEHAARKTVERVVQEAGVAPERVQVHTAVGSAAQELLTEAGMEKYDLMVMGRRGLGGLGGLLLGSVSESVLRLATCPVLLVR